MFAAKFRCDADGWEPTDANLAQVFAGCSRIPMLDMYPAIRAEIKGDRHEF
jgi:hypothetical protein